MAKVWTRIRETIERHGAAGLVSVIGAAGSVPRETGARIVLQPDGGFFGTHRRRPPGIRGDRRGARGAARPDAARRSSAIGRSGPISANAAAVW